MRPNAASSNDLSSGTDDGGRFLLGGTAQLAQDPENPGNDVITQPVLAQSPLAGTLVDTSLAARGAALVVAVPAKLESVAEVPSLAGLTQAEAKQVLEKIGLRLGKVTVLQAR